MDERGGQTVRHTFPRLTHALLAIGLVLNSLRRARGGGDNRDLLAIPLIHVAILVSAETLVRQDPRLIFVVGLAIVAELAAAIS